MVDCKYIADCRARDCAEPRCVCLENDLASLMRDFKEWVEENHLEPESIEYARVIGNDTKTLVHLADFVLRDDGSIVVVTTENKKRLRRRK